MRRSLLLALALARLGGLVRIRGELPGAGGDAGAGAARQRRAGADPRLARRGRRHGGAGTARVPRRPARPARRGARPSGARSRPRCSRRSTAAASGDETGLAVGERPGLDGARRAAATASRSPPRCAATPAARRAGCWCASSGRPTQAQPPGRGRHARQRPARRRRPQRRRVPPPRCAPICSTPTSRACATPWARSRRRSPATCRSARPSRPRSRRASGACSQPSYRSQLGAAPEAAVASDLAALTAAARAQRDGRGHDARHVALGAPRRVPRRAALAARAAPPREPGAHVHAARLRRVRPRRRERPRPARLRDPGGDHVPDGRAERVPRHRADAAEARRGRGARHRELAGAARQPIWRDGRERQAGRRPRRPRRAHEGDHVGDRHALPEALARSTTRAPTSTSSRASLDRMQKAAEAGQYHIAEQARIEAYAFFEFGPEQRLRGLAPELFTRSEGLFWYGAGGQRRPRDADQRPRRAGRDRRRRAIALDRALREAEEAVGTGPKSRTTVITNTAIIVFREGLEAVLILAALMASFKGAQRRLRRPMWFGVGAALVASAATWVVAQTIMTGARALRREALGGGRADRDRHAAGDPQLVLPQDLLDRPPGRPARQETGACWRPAASPSRSCSRSARSASRASTARASRPCCSCRRSCSRPTSRRC